MTPTAPLTISILAPDGAGKTTLIEAVVAALAPHYAGITRFHFLTQQDPTRLGPPVTDPHGQTPRSMLASLVKVGFYLARAWFQRQPRIRAAKRRGHLVILDRDLIDVSIDPKRYRMDAPSWALALLARLSPSPDLTFVLDAEPSIILERSAELNLATLTQLRKGYRDLASRGADIVILDASQTVAQVVEEAMDAIRLRSEKSHHLVQQEIDDSP